LILKEIPDSDHEVNGTMSLMPISSHQILKLGEEYGTRLQLKDPLNLTTLLLTLIF